MKLYYKLTEINEWYNEKWEFFISLKNNKNVLEKLIDLIQKYGNNRFTLTNQLYSEKEINKLIKENDKSVSYTNWLPNQQKLVGKLRGYICDNIYSYETLENKLINGQIQKYIKED